MKAIDELEIPEDLRFGKNHEWIRPENGHVRTGISDYAQDQLGEIVFVELPAPGDVFGRDEAFATIESVKTVSELYMPVGGEILEVNSALEDSPDLINQSPYEKGWIIVIKPSDKSEFEAPMTADDYINMLQGD
ncbi:MAG: glycine cleavage system protein GcvH [Desulfobacterales bacterium]